MGEHSAISWTDHTFNPWIGCARVSPGCLHCYAEVRDQRFGDGLWGKNAPRRVTSDANWQKPLRWDQAAAAAGRRDRVFCASLADVFEDREDLLEPRARLWRLIASTPNLDWLLLTKRPENMLGMVPWGDLGDWSHFRGSADSPPWPTVWLGTTVEDQQRADERIPLLLDVPAAVRFLSCEPLIGPVDLTPWAELGALCGGDAGPPPQPCLLRPGHNGPCYGEEDVASDWTPTTYSILGLHWVIAGGESGGRHARPMHPDWARSLRDQCQAAGVAFHFKQHGSHHPDGSYAGVSGHSAGRELDGQTWDQLPAAVSP